MTSVQKQPTNADQQRPSGTPPSKPSLPLRPGRYGPRQFQPKSVNLPNHKIASKFPTTPLLPRGLQPEDFVQNFLKNAELAIRATCLRDQNEELGETQNDHGHDFGKKEEKVQ